MTIKKLIPSILRLPFVSLILITSNLQAASVEDFSKHPEYFNVKISPDGKHLAALVAAEKGTKLVFLESDTYKVTFAIDGGDNNQPGDYYWANNERVILQVQQLRGSLEAPLNYGEIFAVDYDGGKPKMLFGYRKEEGTVYQADAGFLVSLLKDDDKHVLIRKQELSRKSDAIPKIYKLNIYTGKDKFVSKAPVPYSNFLIDNNGVPRFVSAIDENYNTKLFYTDGKGDQWKAFDKTVVGDLEPIAFSQDNNSVYALKAENKQIQGLYQYNLTTQEETFLFKSDIADPTHLMMSDLNNVYGIRVDEDYPSYVYLESNTKEAQLHKALYQAFKGDKIAITSKTDDGKQIVVHTSGDRNPGSFYLFNTETMKAKPLFNSMPWINPNELSPVEPFRIKTDDGFVINGLLTLPKGKDKLLPTVVIPHGGPHARDYWGYDSQAQMLANAGYAVIQVNFRGSTGYGKTFEEAGWGKWGTKIQDDIIAATKYAVQQGVSDVNRMCIFGASFGGYSALQSSINEPDLFKCAIGYVGVYDLPMLYSEGDIKEIKWGDAYLDNTIGTDVESQIAQSPVYHVDKLKAPVFLIHGEEDQRAPIIHAEKLREALDKKGHPYEWLVKDKEGHGFYNEKNILELNKKVLAFLDKYIGK